MVVAENSMLLNDEESTCSVGEHKLENVDSLKILGVTYSSDCSFNTHINIIIATSRRAIFRYTGSGLTYSGPNEMILLRL